VRPVGRDDEPAPVVARPETAAVLREAVEALLLMLSPFTPHLAEELWERLGHESGVVAAGWPALDAEAAREEEVEIPVQVNGKLRARVTLPVDASDGEIELAARTAPAVQPYLEGMDIVKMVVAQRRLVNIVVRPQKGTL
jgi:leucyl-tRNA synthetase